MYGDRNFGGGQGGGYGGGFNNNRSFTDRQLTPPVKEGEEIDVTIEAVGEKGDGVAKQKGFVLFIPNTKAGERVRIKVTRVLQKVGFGQVIGPALTAADAPQQQSSQRPAEPEFHANEEMDSENFGEDGGGDADSDADSDADDSSDDEKE